MLDLALPVLRDKIGIKSNSRDTYLTNIINGVMAELQEEKGIKLLPDNPYHLLFVVDYAYWRFEGKDTGAGLPRDLRFRMNNLMIHSKGE